MRRTLRLMLGVTLLEVMLVLAIVSLIILMSVRYYQSTTTASQTQQLLGIISAVTAAADNLSLGTAAGYGNVTSGNMGAIVGASNMTSPWGGPITFSSANSTTYTVTIPSVPAGVCTAVKIKLQTNPKFNPPSACASGNFVYSYNSST
ncbi:MAG TPA: hypothetical protein VLH77_01360 [Gammaproteobacteria bacterium]|nr:hypothetical protein [Gammaproteobacteria bacterium]